MQGEETAGANVIEGAMTSSVGDQTIKATAGSVPAPSMTLPPPAEAPYSEIQKMMALAPD